MSDGELDEQVDEIGVVEADHAVLLRADRNGCHIDQAASLIQSIGQR